MRAFIIEDEAPARAKLIRLLADHCPDVKVVSQTDSIRGAVEWLQSNSADIIFMDVELSDGLCFEIFKRTEVEGNVIIVTAYDSYAIRAFKVNSIDYLLKPIEPEELVAAVDKCRVKSKEATAVDLKAIEEMFSNHTKPSYKKRFVAQVGDSIISTPTEEILYFYAADKVVYLVTEEGRRLIVDQTLNSIEEQVDPMQFCRISRGCIASFRSIKSVSKYFDGKLKITLKRGALTEVVVSRLRAQDILDWLDGQ